jgi:hypothetical protein
MRPSPVIAQASLQFERFKCNNIAPAERGAFERVMVPYHVRSIDSNFDRTAGEHVIQCPPALMEMLSTPMMASASLWRKKTAGHRIIQGRQR